VPAHDPLVTDPFEIEEGMDEWLRACAALMRADVRFLIIGGFGAELHFLHAATQVLTHDMDLLLPSEPAELLRGLHALAAAGFALSTGGETLLADEVAARGLLRQRASVIARRGPETLDLMTWAAGLDFDEQWRKRVEFSVRGVPLPVATLGAILRSKERAGRVKDRLFLEQFREVIEAALAREQARTPEDRTPQ